MDTDSQTYERHDQPLRTIRRDTASAVGLLLPRIGPGGSWKSHSEVEMAPNAGALSATPAFPEYLPPHLTPLNPAR